MSDIPVLFTRSGGFNPPSTLITESTVQAEFYAECRLIALPCVLEYVTPLGRVDAALFNSEWTRLIAVVEMKRPERGFGMAQIGRYKRIGVPVFGLNEIARAGRLARQIKRDYFGNTTHTGVELSVIQAMPRAVRGRNRQTAAQLKRNQQWAITEPDECLIVRP